MGKSVSQDRSNKSSAKSMLFPRSTDVFFAESRVHPRNSRVLKNPKISKFQKDSGQFAVRLKRDPVF